MQVTAHALSSSTLDTEETMQKKFINLAETHKPEDYQAVRELRAQLLPRDNPPASTLVGVQALAMEGLLIEIEAIAVIP